MITSADSRVTHARVFGFGDTGHFAAVYSLFNNRRKSNIYTMLRYNQILENIQFSNHVTRNVRFVVEISNIRTPLTSLGDVKVRDKICQPPFRNTFPQQELDDFGVCAL